MEQATIDSIRTSLESERASLERQLLDSGASVEGDQVEVSFDEGFADSAQATSELSELIAHVEQLHSTHSEVVAALTRLDEGGYGVCESCGDRIASERLEALPTARLCLACKQKRG
ncbi:MAG TPA: TraR/DksA C4-type zinc finger protein [Actinomycetota bacterium]|nr:TraR/DksA C4-type zinc finger protein [Actinomycetota bacterium]